MSKTNIQSNKIKLGLLGPEYSYSDLASTRIKLPHSKYYTKNILECIKKVSSSELDFCLVPLENILNGMVGETIDALSKYSESIKIIDSCIYQINHCIGVKSNFEGNLKDITEIYSHPQASGQSLDFIDKQLANVCIIGTDSTSEAVRLMSESSNISSAAIASEEALKKYSSKILTQIPLESLNFTRFILVTNKKLPVHNLEILPAGNKKHITSFCINPRSDRQGLLLDLLNIISKDYGCNLASIHSRPDKAGGFIFFFEIEGSIETTEISECIKELDRFCKNDTGGRAYLSLLGSYPKEIFSGGKIKKISIIGGDGVMGSWLKSFYEKNGITTESIDLKSDKSELKNSDVIIFSVPMNLIEHICNELKEFINPKALLVENCSVKSNCLTKIKDIFHEGQEVLGIHTMFGPSEDSLKGLNVIVTEISPSSEIAQEYIDLFYKDGAKISKASIEVHDKAVAILQGLIQFNSFTLASMLSNEELDIKSLKPFLTPNSISALSSLEKFLNQSEDLVYDIQTLNPEVKKIRESLEQAIEYLITSLDNKNDFNKLFSNYKNSLKNNLRYLLED